MNPEEIKTLQQFLRGGGWYSGSVTGELDEATHAALLAFQSERRITQSGQLDPATRSEMDRVIRYVSHGPETDIDKKVRELYGPGMAAWLNHAEVGPILRWAAAENASIERLNGYLERTEWWQSNSANARQWDDDAASDPATANQRREERMREVMGVAGQLGVALDQRTVRDMAEDSLRLGLDNAQIERTIAELASYDPAGGEGSIHATQQRLRASAAAYYLSPSDRELFDQAQRIAAGTLTEDGVVEMYRMQAGANHPFLVDQLAKGTTVEDYYAEHRRRVAAALEVSPESIDFMNDRRFWPILGFSDNKGHQRPMTWSESVRFVNRLPEADGTARLRQSAAQLATTLHQTYEGVS